MDLLFATQNAAVPHGRVTHTARKGDKWFKGAEIGDILPMRVTGGEVFGHCIVVDKALMKFSEITQDEVAELNHMYLDTPSPGAALAKGLTAVYGESHPDDEFTALYILPVNKPAPAITIFTGDPS